MASPNFSHYFLVAFCFLFLFNHCASSPNEHPAACLSQDKKVPIHIKGHFGLASLDPKNDSCIDAKKRRLPPPPLPPSPPPSSRIDHFLLALTWPKNFCKKPGACTKAREAFNQFTIHGLWPQLPIGSSGNLTYCDSKSPLPPPVMNLQPELKIYWPQLKNPTENVIFWTNEWRKHGTCTVPMFDGFKYFKRAIDLMDKSNYKGILKRLVDGGIHPGKNNLKETDFDTLFSGEEPNVRCDVDDKGAQYLLELRFCLSHDAKTTISCKTLYGSNTRSNCNRPFSF